MKFLDLIKYHLGFSILITVFYILSAITVLTLPRGFEIPQFTDTYILFGPSFSATILLLTIGGYSINRFLIKLPPEKKACINLFGKFFFYFKV